MKTGAKLTAWNWYMIQKPVCLAAAVMSVAELVALALTATSKNNLGVHYDAIFMSSGAWLLFILGYLAVMAISLRPILQAQGKNKGAYTLQTLPVKRNVLLFSNIASTALSLFLLAAWQVLFTVLCYWPTMALSGAATEKYLPQYAITHGDFQLSLVRNATLRILVPTNLLGFGIWLLLLAAPAVLLVCAFYHRGAARFWAICMGIVGAGACAFLVAVLLYTTRTQRYSSRVLSPFWGICLLLALMAAAIFWALHSIRRAAWL
ncbi:MAG: hypothetical protein RRY96_03180 [Ruthenibacterium sp.]